MSNPTYLAKEIKPDQHQLEFNSVLLDLDRWMMFVSMKPVAGVCLWVAQGWAWQTGPDQGRAGLWSEPVWPGKVLERSGHMVLLTLTSLLSSVNHRHHSCVFKRVQNSSNKIMAEMCFPDVKKYDINTIIRPHKIKNWFVSDAHLSNKKCSIFYYFILFNYTIIEYDSNYNTSTHCKVYYSILW